GKVTDAVLGEGAGGAEMCSTNAVYGGPDNYSSDAHYSHALVIINGNCAQSVTDIPNVKYQLVRVLGRVLGLDWSDMNGNVVTGSPPPTDDDKAGFPLMHAMEPVCWKPPCVPNADQPKMDDRAALSRLYPATGGSHRMGNSFPNGVPTSGTARIHGSVYFSNADGRAGQAMQGAKVVARWIDPDFCFAETRAIPSPGMWLPEARVTISLVPPTSRLKAFTTWRAWSSRTALTQPNTRSQWSLSIRCAPRPWPWGRTVTPKCCHRVAQVQRW